MSLADGNDKRVKLVEALSQAGLRIAREGLLREWTRAS